MRDRRRIWSGTLCAAVVATGGLLAACSHNPIEPAPVYMMGADRAIDRYLPVTLGPRSAARRSGSRYAMIKPAPGAVGTAPPERGSRHGGNAVNRSTHGKSHAGRLAISHAAAAHRATAAATPVSAAEGDASATVIPLDEPAPEQTPWVSPPPAERAPSAPASESDQPK